MISTRRADNLLTSVTCHHCWGAFPPEQILWVSEHSDLLGDPLLGPEQQQRFLPSRFTLEGDARDAKGMVCRTLACPRCHLIIPRGAMETQTLFLSILGAPAGGKSFLLTTMVHQLRRLLPLQFAVSISDVDPASNRVLNEYEESLFYNPEAGRLVPLGSLIRKTELEGDLYETISRGHQMVTYPRPFLFALRMTPEHINFPNAASLARLLCLYDNAGEHFLPGKDSATSPVTHHLAQSRALLLAFDPTQEQRFFAAIRARGDGRRAGGMGRISRQEMIIHEAAARIRRYTGLPQAEKHNRPLIIVLTKADQWSSLLPADRPREPWKQVPGLGQAALDTERIEARSNEIRRLLLELCPEIVSAAEGFADEVVYIATSALGDQTEFDTQTGLVRIRPRDIHPRWVSVPLLYTLTRVLPGLIPKKKRTIPR
jgi:hypothetical protein